MSKINYLSYIYRNFLHYKKKYFYNDIIGKPFNSVWTIVEGKITFISLMNADSFGIKQVEGTIYIYIYIGNEIEGSNREILLASDTQKLTQEEIESMKGVVEGDQIIDKLIENSKTYNKRQKYSKEKYIAKKEKKYIKKFYIYQPTLPLVIDVYSKYKHDKIGLLREDSIAYILHMANSGPQAKIMITEDLSGILLAAFVLKIGGKGELNNVFFSEYPDLRCIRHFNIYSKNKRCLTHTNGRLLLKLNKIENSDTLVDPFLEGIISTQKHKYDS